MVARMQVPSNPIVLSQDNLLQWFEPANLKNSWYSDDQNVYVFKNRQSNRLLITVGDSWTFGSNLSNKNQQVYGNLLSEKLESDWLNLSIPATGNFFQARIAEQLSKVLPKLMYKKIDIVFTFTGITRWFNTSDDLHIKYKEWFTQNVHCTEDFDKLLLMLNNHCVERIIKIIKDPRVKLKFGTNFVDALGYDSLSSDQILDIPWYQIMGLNNNQKVFTCLYYTKLETATEFLPKTKHSWFKQWFLDLSDITYQRYNLMADSTQFENLHPLNEGHCQWAEYVYKHLK